MFDTDYEAAQLRAEGVGPMVSSDRPTEIATWIGEDQRDARQDAAVHDLDRAWRRGTREYTGKATHLAADYFASLENAAVTLTREAEILLESPVLLRTMPPATRDALQRAADIVTEMRDARRTWTANPSWRVPLRAKRRDRVKVPKGFAIVHRLPVEKHGPFKHGAPDPAVIILPENDGAVAMYILASYYASYRAPAHQRIGRSIAMRVIEMAIAEIDKRAVVDRIAAWLTIRCCSEACTRGALDARTLATLIGADVGEALRAIDLDALLPGRGGNGRRGVASVAREIARRLECRCLAA